MKALPTAPSVAALEPLKWVAFALMVVDHVDAILLNRSQPWMFELGRTVLPLFAVCFGIGLAHSRSALDAAGRLMLPMVLAQLAWGFAGSAMPNVLCTFSACAIAVHFERETGKPWLWLAVGLLAELTRAEGGVFAVVLVWSAHRYGVSRRVASLGAGWVAWLIASPYVGAVIGLAVPLVHWRLVRLPRLPFRWLYPAHVALLAGIAHALS